MKIVIHLALALAFISLATGCSNGLSGVSGTVTLDKKPLEKNGCWRRTSRRANQQYPRQWDSRIVGRSWIEIVTFIDDCQATRLREHRCDGFQRNRDG